MDGTPAAAVPAGEERSLRRGTTAWAVAILNISGLGLGYVALRAWVRFGIALATTAVAAALLLPVTWQGASTAVSVGLGLALLVYAVDAWFVARSRARQGRTPLLPKAAGLILAVAGLALPLSAAAVYSAAQTEALEEHLEQQVSLTMAPLDSVESLDWDSGRPVYEKAYTSLAELAATYPDSRTAAEVPTQLDLLYLRATDRTACDGLEAVRWFADARIGHGEVALASRAADELPAKVVECGMLLVGSSEPEAAVPYFDEVLTQHGGTAAAGELPAVLTAWRDEIRDGLGGAGGCTVIDKAERADRFFDAVDGELSALDPDFGTLARDALYGCGLTDFDSGRFASAESWMERLLRDHPGHPDADYAARVLVAAAIAQQYPGAGAQRPSAEDPGGPVGTLWVHNYSVDGATYLFTGPMTGSVDLGPCGICGEGGPALPASSSSQCQDAPDDVPGTAIVLPAGEYYLTYRGGPDLGVYPYVNSNPVTIKAGGVYASCFSWEG